MSSIPARIVADIRRRLESGALGPGDRLPSSRALADQLRVSRGSIVAAYEQLAGEGILLTSRGGTRIHPDLALRSSVLTPPDAAPRARVRDASTMLRPGAPLEAVTSSAWRAAWRAAAAEPHAYPSPGSPRLRHLLAEHFRLSRAMPIAPEAILITAGARDGLRATLTALTTTRARLAVEDPGFASLCAVPESVGWQTVMAKTDGAGMSLNILQKIAPTAALVTPNHQFPYGTQMPAERRRNLVEWRHSTPGAFLIEDDYDSELRTAHPALVALDPTGTVLLGSFAKTLTPALGLGYVIVPESLRADVAKHLMPVSGIAQDALANFLAADGLRRHTARMRREYTYRRGVFERIFPDGFAMDGGLGAIIELSADAEAHVLAHARAHRLAVESLAKYWSTGDGHSGVVVGLGGGSREKLVGALEVLRKLIPLSAGGID
ncbi:PLP-dependent aminotransferase family protein [Trueperella pyogenes]|uniref:MocR-like pyridoxine biosynthesis transcription factor PdxR n=1 Tax=Trueperella pyogenes TaxID=1661 RepID=UPI0021685A03|nr:PLP-dependent aminotransferase family protein [Trueperella pyogenes]MCI7690116.1 PLP-dependent aminotransferase family protein [Trueperella pyogenes]MDF2420788.1 PLP-dependent aminotransferase family protein [Trueperella pyogenes]